MARIVITGMGIITPFGVGVEKNWQSLINSSSAIGKINRFDVSEYDTKIAGQIYWNSEGGTFDPTLYIGTKEIQTMSKFAIYGLIAADEAIKDSGIADLDSKARIGVAIGSGIGGLEKMEQASINVSLGKKLGPFILPSMLINIASSYISIKYGFYGPSFSIATACATGNNAIGEAYNVINRGDAEIMVVGGSESALCCVGMRGFEGLRAMSSNYNDTPELASRPWDRDRDGFVMSEGAGVLVLEEYEHAKKRNAKIYAEIAGYGSSSDGFHITAPRHDGNGAAQAIKLAMNKSGLTVDQVDYINAHGTSTNLGDKSEIIALRQIFNDDLKRIPISSVKSAIGHALGAAGAIEAVFSVKAIETNILPATLNLYNPDDDFGDLNLIPFHPQEKKCNVVISNSFGFGGINAVLIFTSI